MAPNRMNPHTDTPVPNWPHGIAPGSVVMDWAATFITTSHQT